MADLHLKTISIGKHILFSGQTLLIWHFSL